MTALSHIQMTSLAADLDKIADGSYNEATLRQALTLSCLEETDRADIREILSGRQIPMQHIMLQEMACKIRDYANELSAYSLRKPASRLNQMGFLAAGLGFSN